MYIGRALLGAAIYGAAALRAVAGGVGSGFFAGIFGRVESE